MRQSKVFRISEEEYKKAGRRGAESIIGKHEGKILRAEVTQMDDRSCWLAYEVEYEDKRRNN